MSELSKQALKVENSTAFPNNNAGLITPSNLRTFNEDMIDSLVDEITYNEDSASWNNSIDALNQFTSSQQPSFTALNEFTASQLVINSGVNSFTQSTDGRLDSLESEVDSLQTWTGSVNEIRDEGVFLGYSTRFHFGGNVSASIVQNVGGPIASINIPFSSVDTGSLLLTASFDNGTRDLTFTKGDTTQFSVNIPDASGSILPPGVVSGSSQVVLEDTTFTDGSTDMFLSTDGAGNLSFDWVKTLHQNIHNAETSSILRGTPLYISGSTGDNANVYFADASNTNRRPAVLIAFDQTLAPGATGTGIISGEIQGVDTNLYPEGTIVYLGVGGGWSATRPSGSDNLVQALGVITRQANNGRGIVFNQIGNNLPNIQEGYTWVGDVNGIPQASPTSSFGDGSGFPFSGSAVITGSLSVSETISSQVYINPQTLDGFTIPTGNNAMLVGPVAIDGTVVVEGTSKLIVLDQVSGSGGGSTIETGSFATTGSNIFIGDQTITGSLFVSSSTTSSFVVPNGFTDEGLLIDGNLRVTNGAIRVDQAIYTAGIYTQTLARNSNDVINVDNGLNIRPNSPGLSATNVSISGSLIVSESISSTSQTIQDGGKKTGTYYKTGSSEMFFGLDSNEFLVISGSGRPNIIEVNPGSGWVEFYSPQVNFNNNVAFRGVTNARNIITQLGNGYEAQFDGLTASGSVQFGQVMNLVAQDPLPAGNIGDLAVSGSNLFFYNGAWTQVV